MELNEQQRAFLLNLLTSLQEAEVSQTGRAIAEQIINKLENYGD